MRSLLKRFGSWQRGAALIIVLATYGSKFYSGWRESRLLKSASAMLEKKDYVAANRLARQVLEMHHDSLSAFYILADATEKQNSEETVSWRAQIARCRHPTCTGNSRRP